MTADARFLALMPSVVTVVKETARDKYGKQTWTGDFSLAFGPEFGGAQYRCRVQYGEKQKRSPDDRVVDDAGTVFIYGDADIDTNDLLVLPDDSKPLVSSVTKVLDETTSVHHTVVTFKFRGSDV